MLDLVVENSRHKFVYYEDYDRDVFINSSSEYFPIIDIDEPIAVYISNFSLLYFDNDNINHVKCLSIYKRYFDIVIILSIIDLLISSIDINVLNNRLNKLFRYCSRICNIDVSNIIEFRNILNKSRCYYKNLYINYSNTGNITNNVSGIIDVLIIDRIIPIINECLGFNKYFSLLIDIDDDINELDKIIINDYINSRCNKYLSFNVLLNNIDWDLYECSNGRNIQYIHDYMLIDFREDLKVRSRHK